MSGLILLYYMLKNSARNEITVISYKKNTRSRARMYLCGGLVGVSGLVCALLVIIRKNDLRFLKKIRARCSCAKILLEKLTFW